MKYKRKTNFKYFLYSAGASLCILGLLAGFAIVEKNGRAKVLGDNSPLFEYKLNKKIPKWIKIRTISRDFAINLF